MHRAVLARRGASALGGRLVEDDRRLDLSFGQVEVVAEFGPRGAALDEIGDMARRDAGAGDHRLAAHDVLSALDPAELAAFERLEGAEQVVADRVDLEPELMLLKVFVCARSRSPEAYRSMFSTPLIDRDAAELATRRDRALQGAAKAIAALRDLGVTALLTGSLAEGSFGRDSDVDLLVTGCPKALKYTLEGMVEDCLTGFAFDLIYLDEVPAHRVANVLGKARDVLAIG
jgi:predicted nucleotidyltransferase